MSRKTRQTPGTDDIENLANNALSLTDPGMKLLQEVHKSQIFMSAQFDEFNKRTQLLEKENKMLKNEVNILQNRVSALELDCNALHQEVYSRYLYISGVPKNDNEILSKVVMDIGEITSTKLIEKNIVSCRREGPTTSLRQKHPQIIVEFDTKCTKELLQANYKSHGPILNRQFDKTLSTNNNTMIYINEYLSTANKKLLYETQQLKARFNIKFVWAKQGTVYLRENESSKPRRIKNFHQLALLINQLENTSM